MNAAKSIQVLLLENEGVVRAGFKALLKETLPTVQVYDAANYGQAVAILSNTVIDFAFLDYHLLGEQEKTGLDVLDYIRLNALATRAVMLSACADQDLVLRCLNAGAWGYIPKSMEGEGVLRDALEAVFQSRLFLPDSVLGNRESGRHHSASEALGVKGRALEVLYYLCQGYSNSMIADQLCLAEGTVRKDYVSQLLKQFKVKSRTQLLLEVSRLGIVIPKPPRYADRGKAG